MVAIDIIGLILTVLLMGPRYAHYILAAVVIGEVGRILMTLYVNAQLDALVAGGIMNGITFHGATGISLLLIYFGGVIFNYFIGMACGGIEREKLTHVLNPFAVVKQPFAVVNIRLAILSGIYNGWQYLAR